MEVAFQVRNIPGRLPPKRTAMFVGKGTVLVDAGKEPPVVWVEDKPVAQGKSCRVIGCRIGSSK